MLAIDFFGLGQTATPASTSAATSAAAPIESRNVVIPAIPDNTVVRCKFDQTINSFRCSPVGLFEPPTVFLIAAAGVALLGIGYAFGRTQFLSRFAAQIADEPFKRRALARFARRT